MSGIYSIKSPGGPTFTFNEAEVDGLGRLTDANETITNTGGSGIDHFHIYGYDKLSQLIDANISNIGGGTWTGSYTYKKNGDMIARTINGATETFGFDGNLMTAADSNSLDWDDNGQMTSLLDDTVTTELTYNWDGKLRHGQKDTATITIDLRYDPLGNRIWKNSSEASTRKYIVDIAGSLPVILMELNSSDAIQKTYIHANGQILAQHDGDYQADKYFYLHDRLGSVREVINDYGNVVALYTYNPFGEVIESDGSFANPWRFTGQFYDSEIQQYYLRARDYNPHISRFTSRDPIFGRFEQPITLHKYLYCGNDPVNKVDRDGEWAIVIGASLSFNAGEASDFISAMIKELGIAGASMARSAIIGSIYDNFVADHVGFTGGAGTAFGYGEEDGWFIGSVFWAATGVANGFGLTVTADYAFSNADRLDDLEDYFVEVGGSVTQPKPWGPFMNLSLGGSISRGIGTDIYLATFSIGAGVSEGREIHGFVGKSWVKEW